MSEEKKPEQPKKVEQKEEESTKLVTPKVPPKPKANAAARPRPTPRKPAAPKVLPPSPKEPLLQEYKKRINEKFGTDWIESSYVNQAGEHTPTFVVKRKHWRQLAEFVREDSFFLFDFVQNYSAVDYESRMEVVLHLYSLERSETLCLKAKLDREDPKIETLTSVWRAADWNEREMYDLLGIHFTDHPNLRRILLPEHWVGHPLRKDYEPYDEGV